MPSFQLDFKNPDREVLRSLKDCLASLPMVEEKAILSEIERMQEPIVALSLDECLKKLEAFLLSDYEEHCAEVGTVPWTFAYRAESYTIQMPPLTGVTVLARLIAPDPSEGNILYGPLIFRTGDDTYLYVGE